MKGKKENKANKVKVHKTADKGAIFTKILAGLIAVIMIGGTAVSLIYPLIFR